VGSSAMPYFNSLASQNVLFTQYYANTHPSIGNYFMMTTGQIITNSDGYTGTVTADNIVRHMLTAGKTWKSYAESLPSVGYIGGDTGAYVRHHNPFTYFSDVVNSSVQRLNLVPFTQFATDLTNNQLPDFSFIVPNLNDDAHNGTLTQADNWLKAHIAPLLSNPAFQKDGILVVVFDEGASTDTAHGGGHIAVLMSGPGVKKQFKSTTLYQHQSLLRTVMSALGMSSYPGAAATASSMSDAFTAAPSPSPSPTPTPSPSPTPNPSGCTATTTGVTVCSPTGGSTVSSPVRFTAAAKSSLPITAMRIYIDNVSAYFTNAASLDVSLAVSPGTHNIVVQAWNSGGSVFKTPLTITTGTAAAGCTASTTGVTVCSPASGSSAASPVHVTAAAKSSLGSITAMRIYVDYVSKYLTNAASLDTSIALASGSHNLTVQAWDSTGSVYKNARTITVP
jgi:acid phosphatase